MSDSTASATLSSDDPRNKAIRQLTKPWSLRWFFLTKLPTCLWWGVSLKSISTQRAEVLLPYSWRTQNPFRSIYFAAQIGAGELATGLLATIALQGRGRISMLAIDASANFTKKANSLTTFTCDQGEEVNAVIQRAVDTKEPQTITMVAKGVQANGEVVSEVRITWSFKAKA